MASPMLYHLSSSLLRINRKNSLLSSSPCAALLNSSSSSHPLYLRLLPSFVFRPLSRSPHPRLQFYSGSSAAAVDGPMGSTAEEAAATTHPWPEWEQFIEKMKNKGYFEETSSTVATTESAASMDLNRLKNASLKFARERFDILRSLPKEDIQTVVECGCPNLFRKAINSAKRLRAFLRLDEGDVCSACNLRGSCDRAYIIAKEDEGARTVDIMRILLSYAVDPVVRSGAENSPVKEHVQESARKLLVELIKLSDTTLDPALPKPAVKPAGQEEQSQKVISKNKQSQNVEMKRGDWLCPNCSFLNFARNVRCLECKEDGPKRVNFNGAEMKLGDWTCPLCEFMNFSRNKKCFRCQESRPKRELQPGEWECPSCDFINFRRNKVCLKCNCDRPHDDEGSQFGDHAWRKPREAKENITLKFGDEEDEEIPDDEEDILPLRKGENKSVERKRTTPGDWTCPECELRNFPRNKKCIHCQESRPKKELQPGEWECPSCDFLNFKRNKVCLKCNCDHPQDNEGTQFEDHSWRKPREAKKKSSLKFVDKEDEEIPDDKEDDILPLRKAENKFVVSKRATPAERRLTSARKRSYPSL